MLIALPVMELVGVIEQGFDELTLMLSVLIALSDKNVATTGEVDELCALREKANRAAALLRNVRLGEQ